MMILGADEGSEGDKSKVFAMQEGPEETDVTTDDYRMTAELRGANYSAPGSVTCRIIMGDGVSRDCARVQKSFDSSRWYFWSFTWQTGTARLTVRWTAKRPVVYDTRSGPAATRTVPTQHYPVSRRAGGRAGLIDATLPGGTYKNVYVGPDRARRSRSKSQRNERKRIGRQISSAALILLMYHRRYRPAGLHSLKPSEVTECV
jgi:hypothetical protein